MKVFTVHRDAFTGVTGYFYLSVRDPGTIQCSVNTPSVRINIARHTSVSMKQVQDPGFGEGWGPRTGPGNSWLLSVKYEFFPFLVPFRHNFQRVICVGT